MEIFEKVREIVVETLSCDLEDVKLESSLAEDLNADSLDAVELNLALEDAFGISIPDEALEEMKTIRSIVEYVEAHAA